MCTHNTLPTVFSKALLCSPLQDVEIKKMSGNATYGFVLFYDLMSAVHAKQYMDGENVHGNNIRVSVEGMCVPSERVRTYYTRR